MSSKDAFAGISLGIVIGAIIGMAAGMLYAPRPGEETRLILKEKTDDFKHKAAEAIDQGKEKAKEVIQMGEEKFLQEQELEAKTILRNRSIASSYNVMATEIISSKTLGVFFELSMEISSCQLAADCICDGHGCRPRPRLRRGVLLPLLSA